MNLWNIYILLACGCNENGLVDGNNISCDMKGNCGDCSSGYIPGIPRTCNMCANGYYVSAGTNKINPTCTGKFFWLNRTIWKNKLSKWIQN